MQKYRFGYTFCVSSVKADGYVLESDVHFPIDMNLLWNAFLQTECPPLKEKY